MSQIDTTFIDLKNEPKVWLVTGVAGFIGSNLLHQLLKLNQKVIGLDSFVTGHRSNLEEVLNSVASEKRKNFNFIEGDIASYTKCQEAVDGVDYVLHQAALGSVPRSINDPIATNNANVTGFLNILHAAKEAKVQSFTYAASSSTYGDHPALPKIEEVIGAPLSPYAVTKYINELYAENFYRTYGFSSIGLRYFNVFGKFQDPDGAYAAVIPKWFNTIIQGESVIINGDGSTSRDFCYIKNVIEANILAAVSGSSGAKIYNVAVGARTSLKDLFGLMMTLVTSHLETSTTLEFSEFRQGDVLHSLASVEKIKNELGYQGSFSLEDGLKETVHWYLDRQ